MSIDGDTVTIEEGQITVTNDQGSRSYPLPANTYGIDGLVAYKTSLAPLETYDRYGEKPEVYELDRRFLVESD